MAKQKTKRGPLETVCTFMEYGCWEWTTGQNKWAYKDGLGGLNFFALRNGELEPLLYCKTLDHAIMWSYGWNAAMTQMK